MEITNENYVDKAEQVMKKICAQTGRNGRPDSKRIVSTSQIRNILSLTSEIYNDARHMTEKTLSSDTVGRIQYLKMRMAYEAGRTESVKIMVEDARLFKIIDEIKDSRDRLILFCHYMEALVAYRKYYGPKEI